VNRDEVVALLQRRLPRLSRALTTQLRATLRVRPTRGRARVGGSKIGGAPDLPEGSAWPTVDAIALAFVAQIDLREVARSYGRACPLPPRGILSFFFDANLTDYENGRTPDRSRVVWTEDTSTLVPIAPPAGAQSSPAIARALELERATSLPELEEIDGEQDSVIPNLTPIVHSREDGAIYRRLRGRVRGKFIGSKILGHADAVQGGEIRLATVLERDGGRRFRFEDYTWTRRRTLVSEANELTLLFQAASGARECWSGSGVLYFWIRKADLERRRFDRAFARLQST
jgi:hypothetical protein